MTDICSVISLSLAHAGDAIGGFVEDIHTTHVYGKLMGTLCAHRARSSEEKGPSLQKDSSL